MKLDWKVISKKQWVAILAAMSLAAALALYLGLYAPLWKKLRLQGEETRALETEVAFARSQIAALKHQGQSRSLIREAEVSLAIEELTRRGKSEEINFTSIRQRPVEKTQGVPYHVLPLAIETESTYEALGSFLGSLDELESSLVTVRSFSIMAKPEKTSKLKASLTLALYLVA